MSEASETHVSYILQVVGGKDNARYVHGPVGSPLTTVASWFRATRYTKEAASLIAKAGTGWRLHARRVVTTIALED